MSKQFALITGATGGIGKSFAHSFAARKFNLLLIDINTKQLKKMKEELREKHSVEVKIKALDLTNESKMIAFIKQLMRSNNIEVLINCAGFGSGEVFFKGKIEGQLKMIQLHIIATVQLVHAVLPGMIKRRKGKIITVSSIAAFLPSPGSSIYAGTKAFLNSFMESIHMEVNKYGIYVQSLCPGLTHTGFHENLRKQGKRNRINKIVPWMAADDVVQYSLKCLDDRKVVCIPGFFNRSVKKAVPILPRKSFYFLSKKIAK